MASIYESIDSSMSQAGQPPNEAEPSGGAKRGAKPKACDTCRPLKTKCAPREGTCGRCERLGINCVRSHVQTSQPSDSAASESSSQQSLEGDDHSADFVGAETIPQQSQEANLVADPTDAETRSNHHDQMDLSLDLTDGDPFPSVSSFDLPDLDELLHDWQGQAVSSTDPSHAFPSNLPDGEPLPQDRQGQAGSPIDPASLGAFSQQSQDGTDHPSQHSGHALEGVAEPFDSSQFLVQHSAEVTGRSFQSVDRGSTPPLSDENMDQSSDMDDSETDSEQSHGEAPRPQIHPAQTMLEAQPCWIRPTPESLGWIKVVRVARREAMRILKSQSQEVIKGYTAADDDDIAKTLYGRRFPHPLQDLGYRMRRRELGYKLRSDVILENSAKYLDAVLRQDFRPSLSSFFESCEQQPAVPEQVWICIKSDGNIPVGTVFDTLPQQGQESQLEQVELDEVTGPDLQLIHKKLWEIYGSSI